MILNTIFSSRWLDQRSREWRTFERWVKQRNSLLHLPIRKVDRKEPRWSSKLSDGLTKMPSDSTLERVLQWRWMRPLRLTERRSRLMKNGKRLRTNDRTKSKRPIRMHERQLWVSLDRRSLGIWKLMEFTHTSLSAQMTHELSKPLRNMALRNPLQVDHRRMLKEEEKSESVTAQMGIRRSRETNRNSSIQRLIQGRGTTKIAQIVNDTKNGADETPGRCPDPSRHEWTISNCQLWLSPRVYPLLQCRVWDRIESYRVQSSSWFGVFDVNSMGSLWSSVVLLAEMRAFSRSSTLSVARMWEFQPKENG